MALQMGGTTRKKQRDSWGIFYHPRMNIDIHRPKMTQKTSSILEKNMSSNIFAARLDGSFRLSDLPRKKTGSIEPGKPELKLRWPGGRYEPPMNLGMFGVFHLDSTWILCWWFLRWFCVSTEFRSSDLAQLAPKLGAWSKMAGCPDPVPDPVWTTEKTSEIQWLLGKKTWKNTSQSLVVYCI